MKLPFNFNGLVQVFKPPSKEDSPKHGAIRKADPYSYQINHIWLSRVLRVSVMTNFVLLVTVMFLISSFNSLLPLKEVRVALLRADVEDNRIYTVEPINPHVDGFKMLLEAKAREFVQKILTINPITQREFIRTSLGLAGLEYRKKFIEERIDSKAIQKIMDAGIRREIKIVSADHLNSLQPGVYKVVVDFEQIDKEGDKITEVKALRAYLAITTKVEEVKEADKYENPLGIFIMDMSIQEREDRKVNNEIIK